MLRSETPLSPLLQMHFALQRESLHGCRGCPDAVLSELDVDYFARRHPANRLEPRQLDQHCQHLRWEVIEHSLKSLTADCSSLLVPTAADTGVTVAVVVTTTAAG